MSAAPPAASVIVRSFNSAETIGAAFSSIRSQSVPAEIVVVDSGSSDATLELAGEHADRIVTISQADFSFGRALNLGAEAARAPVHVALSSHCAFPRADWLEIATDHILRAGAAATCGLPRDGDQRPLDAPFVADHAYVLGHQHWGFTNHASAWSARTWSDHRFDETLEATEDKEWTWRALADGGTLIVDPRLIVPGAHRRSAGARAYYRRLRKEIRSVQSLRPLPPFGFGDAVLEWARTQPRDPFLSQARPFGRTRALEVAARWGATRGSARRPPASR